MKYILPLLLLSSVCYGQNPALYKTWKFTGKSDTTNGSIFQQVQEGDSGQYKYFWREMLKYNPAVTARLEELDILVKGIRSMDDLVFDGFIQRTARSVFKEKDVLWELIAPDYTYYFGIKVPFKIGNELVNNLYNFNPYK